MKRRAYGSIVATSAILLLGCVAQDKEVAGTVRFIDVEGGCWAIELAAERVHALRIPDEFKAHGLKVYVQLEDMPADTITTCQIGAPKIVAAIRSR